MPDWQAIVTSPWWLVSNRNDFLIHLWHKRFMANVISRLLGPFKRKPSDLKLLSNELKELRDRYRDVANSPLSDASMREECLALDSTLSKAILEMEQGNVRASQLDALVAALIDELVEPKGTPN